VPNDGHACHEKAKPQIEFLVCIWIEWRQNFYDIIFKRI